MTKIDWYAQTLFAKPLGIVAQEHAELETHREERRIDKERKLLLSRHVKSVDGQEFCGAITPLSAMIGRARSTGNVIFCGRHVEVYLAPEPQHIGAVTSGANVSSGTSVESQASIARRVNARARKQIRRYVNANNLQGMITLTLAPPSPDNDKLYATVDLDTQRDYEAVRELWHTYKARLRKRLEGVNVDYVVVFELHDSDRTSPEKRGTWHIHVAIKADDAIAQSMMSCWYHGRTDYQDFRYDKQGNRREVDIQNPGAYIAEYIGKEGAQFGTLALCSKKRYTTSRGLSKPKKKSIEECTVEEGKNNILYIDGIPYVEEYMSMYRIPGTDRLAVSAHYRMVDKV